MCARLAWTTRRRVGSIAEPLCDTRTLALHASLGVPFFLKLPILLGIDNHWQCMIIKRGCQN
jgi:hypothetical protein